MPPLDALVRWLPNGSDAVLVLSKKGSQVPLEPLLDPIASLLPSELTGLFLDARSLRDVLSAAAGPPNGPVLIRCEGKGMEGSTVFARIDGGTEALSARAKPNALGLRVSATGSDDVSLVVLSSYEVALAKQSGVDALSNAVASSNRGHPVALGGQSLVESPALLAEAWVLTRHAETDARGIVSVHVRVDEVGRGVGLSLRIRSLAGQTDKLRDLFKRTTATAKGPLAPSYKKARMKIDGGELVVDVSIGRDVLKKFGGR